jgi:hypothetical protein
MGMVEQKGRLLCRPKSVNKSVEAIARRSSCPGLYDDEEARMSNDSANLRRRGGRPFQHEDDLRLRLLLHVEIGSAATGLSINRFCDKFPFKTSDDRWLRKATLKRRYYQRKAFLQGSDLPNHATVASPLAAAMDRYLNEVRSVFLPQKRDFFRTTNRA